MTSIKPKRLPSSPVILFSSVLSCLVIFTTGNPVFTLITGGKVLEGRNGIIQVLFYAGYFLFVSVVLLTLFPKYLEKILLHPYPLLCILAVLPLAAHIYVGTFTRFVADDFSSASLAVNKGIFGATWDWYVNWSGRFSASFFDSVAGYLPPSWMKFAVGTALIMLLAGMTALAFRVLKGSSSQRFFTGVSLSSFILTAAFAITPDLPQSLYWGQGMRSLILPLIPLFVQLSIIFDLYSSSSILNRTIRLILLGILSFFAGGFGETYVVIQTTLFGLFIGYALIQNYGFHRKVSVQPVLIAFFCSLAAMGVTIVAPGNHVRQTYFPPPPGIIDLFLISFSSMGKFFAGILDSGGNILSLGFLLAVSFVTGCLYAYKQNNDILYINGEISRANSSLISRIKPIFLTFLIFGILVFVCFLPAAYGMSTTPPGRTLILPALLFASGISVISFIFGKTFHPFRLPDGDKTKWLSLLAIIAIGIVTFKASSQTLKVVPDYRFFADRFDRADRMIREAKNNGADSVKVPEVHNHFGLSDYGEGTTYWLDNAVDEYYGLHVIIDKHMK